MIARRGAQRGVVAMAFALAAIATRATPAPAEPRIPPGAAWLHYQASYVQRIDRAQPARAGVGVAMAGVELDALLGRRIAYLVGVDLHAGATVPVGFAYQVDLRPLGVAVRLGATGALGVSVGVGATGAVGTLDDGVELPALALLEVPLGARLRLVGRARAVWLAAAPRRAGGAPSAAWADELDAWVAVRLGRRYRDHGFPSGNGTLLGVAYREREGARMLGVVLAYGVDLATR
ncbi:MAG: hypothetical protein KA201_30505 [Kofleriaceae bacterium]|nr:hypothetical protein [Kofleriaceae bacterium]